MEGEHTISYTVNPPDYKDSIRQENDFYIQFSTYTLEMEAIIIKTLHIYLQKHDILYITDLMITIIKELINNAIKANVKRLYFKQKDLDIYNEDDYSTGMENFKAEVYENESDIFSKLEKANLHVRVQFMNIKDRVKVHVINNIPILDEELNKIESRITKAFKYHDISDLFDDLLDDSEGAGIGLIMALMLLKNAGLSSDSFKMKKDEDSSVAILDIQKDLVKSRDYKKVADVILKEVEKIPSFPENIMEIQKLCSNPESTIKEIAISINRDPGLTTDILKLANSADYITINKVETIEDAVKIIGKKGINALLVASGVQEIMAPRYREFEATWKNSTKTAFYAQRIAIHLKMNRLSEFVYLSALLSDIGKIVLLSIEPEKTEMLKNTFSIKGMEASSLLEEIGLGISHNALGALILKKWEFDEALAKTVEFHHSPYIAPEEYRELIFIVYLAHIFTEVEEIKSRFEIVDEDVLNEFDLNEKENFEKLHDILIDSYKNKRDIME